MICFAGLFVCFGFFYSCNNAKYECPFQNPSLSFEERAQDLVSRLTLDEKISQMLNKTPAIERLGIPAYDWWNECLHGIGRTEYAVTVFPQAIAMAAGWDVDALRQMADYTAEEGRAIYNISQRKEDYSIYHGLTYWTPNINIFRDPRWGRGQETYGEDPYLTAMLGKNFVQGLQGNDKRYLKAAAAADAVFHGTDLDCGREAYLGLKEAVEEGLITEEQIDVSLKRLMIIRMRLGMFDPPSLVPFSSIDTTALENPAHKALALKMAQQSIVLLKNEKNLLPVKNNTIKKIAIIGPNINNPEVQLGNYNGFPSNIITPLEGLKEALGPDIVVYSDTVIGCYGDTPKSFSQTIENVSDADLIVYVGGISPRIEGEEMNVDIPGFYKGDRTSIHLPQIQTNLMKALKSTGKPLVFVMMTGSAIACNWEVEHVDAILNIWYAGEFAGKAVADVIFGNYNPSGRLPITFYASDEDLPDFEDYDMSNRTYKYFKGETLYPFGYGLSYTDFAYEWIDFPKSSYSVSGNINCKIKINNVGEMDGDEIAQVYIKYPQTGTRLPLKELCAFERKHIAKGGSEEMQISIPINRLAKWDERTGTMVVPIGNYALFVGGNSERESAFTSFEIKP